jgi:hypothetical protein
VRALYGVHDVMDARRNAMVLNIHAYDDSGLSQLEVRQCCYVCINVVTTLQQSARRCGVSQMPRLMPYIANNVFIVSERGVDSTLDDTLSVGVVFPSPDVRQVRVVSLRVTSRRSVWLVMLEVLIRRAAYRSL